MPLLLYCAFLAKDEPPLPQTGVAGKPVAQQVEDALAYWYSELTDEELRGAVAREAALECHRVIESAFAVTTVLPFRFPTAISALSDLAERSELLLRDLERLRGMVQMELRVGPAAALGDASTGTEYLRARQGALHAVSSAVGTARNATADIAREWRQRGTQSGTRCFALVSRGNIEIFRARMATAEFGPDVRIRVSGPWPPTEFADQSLNGDKV